MTSTPLDEPGRPVHRNNISPRNSPPRVLHGPLIAKGIETPFLDPMSPTKFISEFFPRNNSEEVSSAFKLGLFNQLLAICSSCGGRKETSMYNPFVRTNIALSHGEKLITN